MGRKHSNISGLSRFVSVAFNGSDGASSTALEVQARPSVSTPKAENVRRASELEDGHDVRPAKKRKVGLLGPGLERYDATGLVPFYTEPSQVPANLQKYFSQRTRYFSRYASGCLLDEEGWYSVTPERVADQIAERCRCGTVLDAFCGVGGNAIAFARTCERVIALDTSPVRLALARHNAALYGVADRIEFVLADFLSFARTLPPTTQAGPSGRKIDVVFLSPPWGGPSYLTDTPAAAAAESVEDARAPPEYSLASIQPVHGAQLFALARGLTKNIAFFLPRNVRLEEVAALLEDGEAAGDSADAGEDMVEVEEEWMGSKLKALTCYFGGLAAGQEELFDG
ncbi:S-adenosyl-L-methionine-dependent methyltransferase [Amylocystis lapponica]|nr:S-adenosyl-L-methionine-dependent methyltransferase [Amylocystis lapponica]